MPAPTDDAPRTDGPDSSAPETSVLGHLVQRLKSQPLLLALGVLLILANVATASVDALRVLLPAAVVIFAVAVTAWVAIEIVRFRRRPADAGGTRIHVSARRVGRSGEVIGVDDTSDAPASGSTNVTIKADGVQGRVVGVQKGPRRS